VKDDEKEFAQTILKACETEELPYLREIAKNLNINEKRAAFIVSKWESKGWLDCGINPLAGWLTEKGKEELKEVTK